MCVNAIIGGAIAVRSAYETTTLPHIPTDMTYSIYIFLLLQQCHRPTSHFMCIQYGKSQQGHGLLGGNTSEVLPGLHSNVARPTSPRLRHKHMTENVRSNAKPQTPKRQAGANGVRRAAGMGPQIGRWREGGEREKTNGIWSLEERRVGMGMGMGRRTNTSLAGINEAMPAFLISYPLEILSRMIGRLARINFYICME